MLLPLHLFLTLLLFSLTTLPQTNATPCCTLVPPKPPSPQSQSSTKSTSSTGGAGGDGVVAAAYYPGWTTEFGVGDIDWERYNVLLFAFAVTTPNPPYYDLLGEEETLKEFVAAAKENKVNASLSIGGWTGSLYFSQLLSSNDTRTAFVKEMVGLVGVYGLDGLDFDWEYPSSPGIGCNTFSSSDTTNFLAFLRELRSEIGNNVTLSAPSSIKPWLGESGEVVGDVSGFGGVLDWIMIMNYDVWGSWSPTVGPNAPLNDTCASSPSEQVGSAVSAVESWVGAGMPASQIVLGLAAYGHSFHVDNAAAFSSSSQLALYPPFNKSLQPLGTGESNPNTTTYPADECGNAGGPGGIFTFGDMIKKGYLTANGTKADGMDWIWDGCSQTPFIYNPTTSTLISYDDAQSFAAKGRFINDQGLRGFAIWDVTGDSAAKDGILVTSVWEAMGIERDEGCDV